jgi:predicted lipid-binding transport protein (Tim44 family)
VARLPALALAFLLVHAPAALAIAGGGSGSYGGGGGGGSSGGFSGSGSSGSGTGSGGPWWLALVIIGGILAALFLTAWIGAVRYRARRRRRVERVRAAAAEAAQDDPAFDSGAVVAAAERLFRDAQAAWDARDRERLAAMVPPALWTEWRRRLDDFERKGWHNRVDVQRIDSIEHVGLVNRERDDEDRVVVRIQAVVRDYVEDSAGNHVKRTDSASEVATVTQYWTLGKHAGGRWRLVSIEEQAEGEHHLDDDLVATPWDDRERLRDASVVEGAVAEAPAGVPTAQIADLDFEGSAREAANDLSLADPRFSPDVLQAAARRAVAAWAEAVDGEDAGLAAVASPEALQAMLYPAGPAGNTRVVVRGPRIVRLAIAALDAAAQPPEMTVEVRVRGRRYVEDRDTTTVLSGSRERETEFTERWTLALDGVDGTPWRIVDAAAPSAAGA